MQTRRATAVSCPNIAFVKYWGNRNDRLRLPANNSISMNLKGLETRTTVSFDPDGKRDVFVLQGREQSGEAQQRVASHIDLLRKKAGTSWKARVDSESNIPAGAGIASSAAGFAALTVAAAAALQLDLTVHGLSALARRGSGSACRSIPNGFVEWYAADRDEDSFAESIAPPDHWRLVDAVAVFDAEHKQTGSTDGNRLARTSPYQEARVMDAPRRLSVCRRAIQTKDFAGLAMILEEETRMMHQVMRSSTPPLDYLAPATRELMRMIPAWRAQGLPVAFSVDAGPNVHCICPEEAAAEVERRLQELPAVRRILTARPGFGARVVAAT
jgi:diphosphomevalonate decarboxylase